jgi:hypothetical protein
MTKKIYLSLLLALAVGTTPASAASRIKATEPVQEAAAPSRAPVTAEAATTEESAPAASTVTVQKKQKVSFWKKIARAAAGISNAEIFAIVGATTGLLSLVIGGLVGLILGVIGLIFSLLAFSAGGPKWAFILAIVGMIFSGVGLIVGLVHTIKHGI